MSKPLLSDMAINRLLRNLLGAVLLVGTALLAESFPLSNRKHKERTLPLSASSIVSTTLFSFSSSTEEKIDALEGSSNEEMFVPKLRDGIAFNLFGIGRKEDELESNGAFQPPMNSMTGLVVVITGASSGLGLESAKRLALAGATVIATARTESKTSDAVQEIRNYCRGGPNPASHGSGAYTNKTPMVRGITLDLADLSSVRNFPERYRKSMLSLSKISNRDDTTGMILPPTNTDTKKINVLMNNACGGSVAKREITVDGYETIFQTGYLGHFVLTARLYEEGLLNDIGQSTSSTQCCEQNFGCTVINVSSSAHRSAEIYTGDGNSQDGPTYGFDFDNIQSDLEFSFRAYSKTKLANIMFTKELQRRINLFSSETHDNSWLTAVSLEPGVVATNIWKNAEPTDATWKDKILPNILTKFMTKVERGSNANVWLAYASSPNSNVRLVGGQHYDENRNRVLSSKFSCNVEWNQKLWKLSEELGGTPFDLETPPLRSVGTQQKQETYES